MRIDRGIVAKCKWEVVRDVMYRPPQVDDLEALGEQAVDVFGRQVTVDTRSGRRRRLVNVHPLDRLALFRRIIRLLRVVAADG